MKDVSLWIFKVDFSLGCLEGGWMLSFSAVQYCEIQSWGGEGMLEVSKVLTRRWVVRGLK